MRDRRSILGIIGAVACLSAMFATTATAQAAAPAHSGPAGQVLTVPATVPGLSAKSAAAEPPTAWPKPNKIVHVPAGGSVTCDSGNLCTAVYDPTKADYVVFYLYYCDTYTLSNWSGSGSYRNSQTGGATAQFFGQSGNLLKSVPAGGSSSSYNWSPVYSIRNC
ncbi:hypothetical protein [Streptomyces sp. NPDC058371]|uniref:hypothetical protein n=1 Tax=Streptomyces sp. NPDC058371 TaxID=3346463 RepID=UPI00365E7C35